MSLAGRDSEERRYCPLRDVIAKSGAIVPAGRDSEEQFLSLWDKINTYYIDA
ncbi:hypothetical protein L3i20_v201680 [Paenibacillus sp. L3-i20]|nr:hypothetical protein L3i20_v201680 [Paenibacillus sp. L3-i20]